MQFKLREQARTAGADASSARGMRTLVTDFDRCRVQLDEITDWAWGLRLVPIEPLLAELLAHARTLAAAQLKRLRVSIDGGRVQLERSILDALGEPLLHLVRNAVNHGVEAPIDRGEKGDASLAIRAESSGPNVVLTIEDDGRGIDREAVRKAAVARGLVTDEEAQALDEKDLLGLIFRHGFSTRSDVSDVSGRGVGLDVVRSAVEAVGGTVTVASEPGVGTSFSLTLPATISKERNLVIETADGLYAIPSRQIAGLVRLSPSLVQRVAGGDAVLHEGRVTPLHSLRSTLGTASVDEEEPIGVVVDDGGGQSVFAAPRLLGEFSLLRRPIDRVVASSSLVGASATFEDGRLILILSVPALLRRKRGRASVSPGARGAGHRTKVLAIDDSTIVRDLLTEVLGHAGFDVRVAPEGEAGLAALATDPPDVVLLDVDMPGMDGFEVLRRIRDRSAEVPVVMLTTRASAEDRSRASSLGASGYAVKAQFQEATFLQSLRDLSGPKERP